MMFMTDEQIAELTKRRRSAAQGRVLKEMGVTARKRPDGSFAVLVSHVEQLFGVGVLSDTPRAKTAAPRFDMVK